MKYFDVDAEIVLNPTLLGEREGGSDWALAMVDSDLGKYLRKLYKMSFYGTSALFYFWVPVISEAAHVFRKDIGLPRQPEVPLHLSFGHYIEGEIYNGLRCARLERDVQ
jgi:hypothetical protein